MKLFVTIVTLFILISQGITINGQSTKDIKQIKINISATKKPLRKVIQEIEQKTKVIFSYNSAKIAADSLVSVYSLNGTLGNVLNTLFSKSVAYRISSNNIILFRAVKKKPIPLIRAENVKPYEFRQARITDTVVVYKTDTVIKMKVDTVIAIRRDTITKVQIMHDNSKVDKKKSKKYAVGLFYQFLRSQSYYQHFGLSQKDQGIKKVIKASEKPSSAYRAGVTGSVFFSNNIRITSGISLLKIIEKYSYKAYSDTAGKEFTALIDNGGVSLSGENTYKYVSLPLFIGWEYGISPKLHLDTNIGGWFNLLNSSKGLYTDLNRSDSYRLAYLKDAPLNKLTIDIAIDVSIEYEFYKNIALKVTPSYNLQVGSDFESDYPVTKHRTAWGYNFAIIKNF